MALVPPKKSNWTEGVAQVGVFVRTEKGSTLEMVQDKASREELTWALILMTGLEKAPTDVVRKAIADWEARTAANTGAKSRKKSSVKRTGKTENAYLSAVARKRS